MTTTSLQGVPQFGRRFFGADDTFTRIGTGALGGKAEGLLRVHRDILPALDAGEFPGIEVAVPTLTVLATDCFEAFMRLNDLDPLAFSEEPDGRIAHAFQRAELPPEILGDLRALIARVHTPLAVRSSSRLEDALDHPFAGVYGTKMIPNNAVDTDTRFSRMVEAVKFVYASTFFQKARRYLTSIGQDPRAETMAVILQEVVGIRTGDRFFPDISGVARSYSHYPAPGSRPEEGVVNLALGLGKTIVDGGVSWVFTPTRPAAPPPFNGFGDMLKKTQNRFWAIHMGQPPLPDPIRETEYLVECGLDRAEADEALAFVASTYDPSSDRLRPGIAASGPRVLDFAPLLTTGVVPLTPVVLRLLEISERHLGAPVEIEFALTLDRRRGLPARLGFLQVRPMRAAEGRVAVTQEDLGRKDVLLASESVLGNGHLESIRDVVFVKPDAFEARHTRRCAHDLEGLNRALAAAGRPYILIGFGRWGSSDPWLGIPVDWSQIHQARVIVEATLPGMNPDPSQGSHFFHNLISFRTLYLSVRHGGEYTIDWAWLDSQETAAETEFVKHVRTRWPLTVKVDSQSGRGVVRHEEQEVR